MYSGHFREIKEIEMLEEEKQTLVYNAVRDINKTYREQEITEKDPLLYVQRIQKWLSLFYAYDVSMPELTQRLNSLQRERKSKQEDANHS